MMSIEIVPKYGSRDVMVLMLNGEEWKEIHVAIYGRTPRFPACKDETECAAAFRSFEFQKVRNYVIRRLSMQSYHSQELNRLLKNRLVTKATREKIIGEFIEKGFFNDQLWVESFIRIHRKRLSLSSILQKMRMKGISEEEIETIRQSREDPEQEKLSIQTLLDTRYRLKNLQEFSEKQKVINALLRKGFSFENIRQVLSNRNLI